MLLTLLAGNLNVAPPLPARAPSAYYAEVEPFIREQRGTLTGALYTTYYSASDLTIFARRQQDIWESELFDRPQRRESVNLELYGQWSSSIDLAIYFRRRQEIIDAESLSSAPNAPNLAITSFQPIPPVTTGSEFIIRARRRGRR